MDSLRLAEEISKEAVKKNCTVKILIEVNVANEATKFGTQTEDTIALVTEIAKLPGIEINGLMTIAPYVENAEENRQYFSKLKQLSVDIMHKNIDNITVSYTHLSENIWIRMTGILILSWAAVIQKKSCCRW